MFWRRQPEKNQLQNLYFRIVSDLYSLNLLQFYCNHIIYLYYKLILNFYYVRLFFSVKYCNMLATFSLTERQSLLKGGKGVTYYVIIRLNLTINWNVTCWKRQELPIKRWKDELQRLGCIHSRKREQIAVCFCFLLL